jgi:hypothetical protein
MIYCDYEGLFVLRTWRGCQPVVPERRLTMASTRSAHPVRERPAQVLCDELVVKLEEVDTIVREEIRREIDSVNPDMHASSRLACLLRCRSDVQSAITSLLGSSE